MPRGVNWYVYMSPLYKSHMLIRYSGDLAVTETVTEIVTIMTRSICETSATNLSFYPCVLGGPSSSHDRATVTVVRHRLSQLLASDGEIDLVLIKISIHRHPVQH